MRIVHDERAHEGEPEAVCLPGERVGVGEETVAQLRVAAADRFDLRTVRPWNVLAPDPAVGSEDGAEGAKLEPACVELTALGDGMEEPANVRRPIWHPGHAKAETGGNLASESSPVRTDVA